MNHSNSADADSRRRSIIRVSTTGILANGLLAALKAGIGLLSHSIAIVLDAVNNLSDALSSLITIIGTHLSAKAPDRQHPMGHGRAEYLTALAVSALVLYAGITSAIESIRKLLHPVKAEYSVPMLVILGAAVTVKLLLGRYVRKKGEALRSDALKASGTDALLDALVSASVLFCAILFITTGISLEAWVGLLIAMLILRSGYGMLTKTLDELLGKRMDAALADEIRAAICEDPDVHGAYDLNLHSYGPERTVGSVHIEVDDTMTAEQLDPLERRISERIWNRYGIALTAIGVYARNTHYGQAASMRARITKLAMSHPGVLQVHGFYVDPVEKTLRLDLILDFGVADRTELFEHIRKDVQVLYPDYRLILTLDPDL